MKIPHPCIEYSLNIFYVIAKCKVFAITFYLFSNGNCNKSNGKLESIKGRSIINENENE